MTIENPHEIAVREQKQYIDAILKSQSRKKIVVAGPGTGKTFLFKELLKIKDKKALTLTFVNSLVDDLSIELYGLSEVKTLHGFARSVIAITGKRADVFPGLSTIINDDSRLLTGDDVNFDQLFLERDDSNTKLEFYKRRKDYYGYYGYTDLVYAAVRYLETYKREYQNMICCLLTSFRTSISSRSR